MKSPAVKLQNMGGPRPGAIRKIVLPISSPHQVPATLRSGMMVFPQFHLSAAAGLYCGISFGLTLLFARGVTQYERIADPDFAGGFGVPLGILWLVLVAYLIGLGCHYLDALLKYSKSNRILELEGSEFTPRKAFRSLLRWLICFVCGPVAVFGVAAHYWIYCGDPDLVDYMILGEMIVPSLMYALLGVLVLSDQPRQIWPRPAQVIRMVQRLGWHGLITCACVSVAASVLVVFGAYAIALLQSQLFAGIFLLWACWFGLWECAAITMRLLGTWFYQTRKRGRRATNRLVNA